MEVEAHVLAQPPLDVVVLVASIVIEDHVDWDASGNVSVDVAQELQEFSLSVPGRPAPITVPSRTLSAANRVVVPLGF